MTAEIQSSAPSSMKGVFVDNAAVLNKAGGYWMGCIPVKQLVDSQDVEQVKAGAKGIHKRKAYALIDGELCEIKLTAKEYHDKANNFDHLYSIEIVDVVKIKEPDVRGKTNSKTKPHTHNQAQVENSTSTEDVKPTFSTRLAPNGKPSNLTEKQWHQVRTPEFKAWFGGENDPENASKVVDENGEPLVVYHGTDKRFKIFNTKKTNQGIHWFARDKESVHERAQSRGVGYVMPVFLNIRNPASWKEYDNLGLEQFGHRGLDGAILEDMGRYEYFVFSPTQIKSATDNRGTFDASNPDITFSTRNLITAHSLDASRLKDAARLGGMPLPSVAVTRVDAPYEWSTHKTGVMLVAGQELADPELGNEVFSADAWAGVFPDTQSTESSSSADILKGVEKLAKKTEKYGAYTEDQLSSYIERIKKNTKNIAT